MKLGTAERFGGLIMKMDFSQKCLMVEMMAILLFAITE